MIPIEIMSIRTVSMMKPMAGARGAFCGSAGWEMTDMIRPEDNRPVGCVSLSTAGSPTDFVGAF